MGQPLQKKTLPQRYLTARIVLMVMIVLSFINLILIIIGSGLQFTVSASFPYFAVMGGAILDANSYLNTQLGFILGCVASVIWIGLFVLCFVFSKKKLGFMIAAAALFAADCLFMIPNFVFYIWILDGEVTSSVIEVLFHIWILWSLIAGCLAGRKLKKKYGTLTPDPARVLQEEADIGPYGGAQAARPYYGSYDPSGSQPPAQPCGQTEGQSSQTGAYGTSGGQDAAVQPQGQPAPTAQAPDEAPKDPAGEDQPPAQNG